MNLDLLMGLALLVVGAKFFGFIFEKMKMSPLVGEIFAGILIGPVLGLVMPNTMLGDLAGLGILFFLFLIGLSTKFDDFRDKIYESGFIAFGGAALSFLAGFLIGYFVFSSVQTGLFLGVALISTSTAMSIRALVDTGRFHTSAGRTLIAVNLADEIIAILALALLTTYMNFGQVMIWEATSLFLAIIGFFLIMLTVGSDVVGRVISFMQSAKDEQTIISVAIAVLFVISFISEHVGIAAVTGAFLAGVAMSKSKITETNIIPKAKTIGYGLFIPLFFAYSAISFDISTFVGFFWLIMGISLVGILAKLVGCGFMSKLFNYRGGEQKLLGLGMMPRGEYSIITAQLALTVGAIATSVYTVVISFVMITIVITPILIRIFAKD